MNLYIRNCVITLLILDFLLMFSCEVIFIPYLSGSSFKVMRGKEEYVNLSLHLVIRTETRNGMI